jgi:hypothetical protein
MACIPKTLYGPIENNFLNDFLWIDALYVRILHPSLNFDFFLRLINTVLFCSSRWGTDSSFECQFQSLIIGVFLDQFNRLLSEIGFWLSQYIDGCGRSRPIKRRPHQLPFLLLPSFIALSSSSQPPSSDSPPETY